MADQSRKWLLTMNNPLNYGYTHEFIKDTLSTFKNLVYWCMVDEIGDEGKTPHTHLYIASANGIRFDTLQNKFSHCDIRHVRGSSQQNRDYLTKSGDKHKDKKETQVEGTFEEWGEVPVERQGQRTDIIDLYDMVKSGLSDADIMEANPEHMLRLDKIDHARQALLFAKYKGVRRLNLRVTYIWGPTRSGKTSQVLDQFGDKNVYRVTNYKHPFDSYEGQPVIVFDEFRSSLPISDMLVYLDIYSFPMPSRYRDKVPCFEHVFLISNIPLDKQYPNIQIEEPETWNAFLARIHEVQLKLLPEQIQEIFPDITLPVNEQVKLFN